MTSTLTSEILSESEAERSQELGTVASIYLEELTILSPFSGNVSLPVSPVEPLAVTFPPDDTVMRFHHLPPIQLKFDLPETYPLEAPPVIELATSPAWFPSAKLEALKNECLGLWEEYGRGQVVYTIVDHARQCIERGLDISGTLEVPVELREKLVAFDKETKRKRFDRETYDCGICLEPKPGSLCHQLRSCTHVFCRPCLHNYYTSLITEGDVSSVRCSDPSCVKNATRPSLPQTLPPEELLNIGIAPDIVTRYSVLKKKKALAADPRTIYCPRKWCQAPSRASVENVEASMEIGGNGYWLLDRNAPPPPAHEADDKKDMEEKVSALREKLQVCSACSLAFCQKCLASWHGDFQICKPADGTITEEEIANEKFLRENTTPCPTCETPVLKSHGCNHMICTCATHFCFLCSAYLPAENPYFHYNTIGTDCFQRLWEGEDGDIENQRLIESRRPPEVPQLQPRRQPRQQPQPQQHAEEDLREVIFEDDTDSDRGEELFVLASDSDSESDEELVDFDDVPDGNAPPPAPELPDRGRGGRRARDGGRGGEGGDRDGGRRGRGVVRRQRGDRGDRGGRGGRVARFGRVPRREPWAQDYEVD